MTITTTYKPARDLGFLLHKHPDHLLCFDMPYGNAHIFYPEATDDRCTMALLLAMDPVGLVRGRKGLRDDSFGLAQYVNDRPYTATSLLSTTIAKLLGTALGGRCNAKPELTNLAIPLETKLTTVHCGEGESLIRQLFEPLGYDVSITAHPLDSKFPDWGAGDHFTLSLNHTLRLKELLNHLFVLVPVMDGEKHYWISDDEVDKLLSKGKGWLASHPAKEKIVFRYMRKSRRLAKDALHRLSREEKLQHTHSKDVTVAVDVPEDSEKKRNRDEECLMEEKIGLYNQRLNAVTGILKEHGAQRILDLGCGEGKLLQHLLEDRDFHQLTGMDVSHRSLERAAERLEMARLPDVDKKRIKLIQGSLMYRDDRLKGFDAAVATEVVEHLDLDRLEAFKRVVFECALPGVVVITTPNREYNTLFESLPPGKLRHPDHRFEWTREEFRKWAKEVAQAFGYGVEFRDIGPVHASYGAPTQMGVFKR